MQKSIFLFTGYSDSQVSWKVLSQRKISWSKEDSGNLKKSMIGMNNNAKILSEYKKHPKVYQKALLILKIIKNNLLVDEENIAKMKIHNLLHSFQRWFRVTVSNRHKTQETR